MDPRPEPQTTGVGDPGHSSVGDRGHGLRALALLLSLLTPLASAAGPEVNLYVSRNVAPAAKVRVNLSTRNVPAVRMRVFPFDAKAAFLARGRWPEQRPATAGRPAAEWVASVLTPGQKPNPNGADTYYSRQTNLPKLRPGAYVLTASGGGREAWAVVNVTDLRVVVKRSPRRVAVWTTDFSTGRPVPARVTLAAPGGSPVSLRAGADGLATLPQTPGLRAYAVEGPDGDLALLSDLAETPDGRLIGHVTTDRPIYRPGQTLYWRVALRRTLGQGYALPTGEATVELRDAKDDPVERRILPVGPFGTVDGSFAIPQEGMTGPYTLVATQGRESVRQTITVAAYRKPEFRVSVAAPKRALAGEPLNLDVSADTYFGSPVPGAVVRVDVRRSPLADDAPREWIPSGDGNLYPRDTYGDDDFVGTFEAQTDARGRARVTIPTDKARGDRLYSAAVTVTDATRRQITSSASVPVYAAAVRLGVSTEVGYANLGEVVPFEITRRDLDGKPAPGRIRLRVVRYDLDPKTGRPVAKTLTETTAEIPASGRATVGLPAREAGDLTVLATSGDGTGRTASAGTSLYVAGNLGERGDPKAEPTVTLRLDRAVYRAGATARVSVETNRPGAAVLLTLEGRDLFRTLVIPRAKTRQTWAIPVDEGLGPNAVVSAFLWDGVRSVGASADLPVPVASKRMRVEVRPKGREVRPGERQTVEVRTLGADGRPISAAVSLAVVDEAIFALSPDGTPDPYLTFWGERANLVTTALTAPEELSGGAYQRVSGVVPVRRRFEDTAFWTGRLVTGTDGRGEATFEVPGNLTTWRATARAFGRDTSAGAAVGSFVATRPVTLRLAGPRRMVRGDVARVTATVDNRTDRPGRFRIEAAGFETREIEVPARGQGRTVWTVTAEGTEVRFAASVRRVGSTSAEEADALEQTIPVDEPGVETNDRRGGEGDAVRVLTVGPNSRLTLTVEGSYAAAVDASAAALVARPKGTVPAAVDALLAATVRPGLGAREAVAALSRDLGPSGWGWWNGSPPDASLTAAALRALALARNARIEVPEGLFRSAVAAADDRYGQTGLWEDRAALAAALALARAPKAADRVAEVAERGLGLSPFGRLSLAEGWNALGRRDDATRIVAAVLKDATRGDAEIEVSVGEGPGWTRDADDATALALELAAKVGPTGDVPLLRRRVARSLGRGIAVRAVALTAPPAGATAPPSAELDGAPVVLTRSTVGERWTFAAPLVPGEHTLRVRTGGARPWSLDLRSVAPAEETTTGPRVLRRLEVQGPDGLWREAAGEVAPGATLRVTTVVWGDGRPDALRLLTPIPAGFEFVDSEGADREDVRDGRVETYLLNADAPVTVRHYLRAEGSGEAEMGASIVEYLRRSRIRGIGRSERLRVGG